MLLFFAFFLSYDWIYFQLGSRTNIRPIKNGLYTIKFKGLFSTKALKWFQGRYLHCRSLWEYTLAPIPCLLYLAVLLQYTFRHKSQRMKQLEQQRCPPIMWKERYCYYNHNNLKIYAAPILHIKWECKLLYNTHTCTHARMHALTHTHARPHARAHALTQPPTSVRVRSSDLTVV